MSPTGVLVAVVGFQFSLLREKRLLQGSGSAHTICRFSATPPH